MARAVSVRENAYAPYSKFKVGAALLSEGGAVFVGCNVENVSFGLTICAERAALLAAVAAGSRKFVALALTAETPEPTMPCGACRQFLMELCPSLMIAAGTTSGAMEMCSLAELLPRPFQKITSA